MARASAWQSKGSSFDAWFCQVGAVVLSLSKKFYSHCCKLGPPSCNMNRYLVFTGKANAQLSLVLFSDVRVVVELWVLQPLSVIPGQFSCRLLGFACTCSSACVVHRHPNGPVPVRWPCLSYHIYSYKHNLVPWNVKKSKNHQSTSPFKYIVQSNAPVHCLYLPVDDTYAVIMQ